jgi:hypothetical protein
MLSNKYDFPEPRLTPKSTRCPNEIVVEKSKQAKNDFLIG